MTSLAAYTDRRDTVGARSFIAVLTLLAALSAMMLLLASHASADPSKWQAEGWETDFSRTVIDLADVQEGGPARDGIPPINGPSFIGVSDVEHLSPLDPVMSFTRNGETRAYPLRVMTFHQIVNDVVGGAPVAVTYCPLCNSAMVFDRTVGNDVLVFGTTGKLRNSDLIMYDRATESWWQQFSGEAIVGSYGGTELTILPSQIMSFELFAEAHPDGIVMEDPSEFVRPYGLNPYQGYDTSAEPFLYTGTYPEGIAPLQRVVMVRGGNELFAISTAKLAEEGFFEKAGMEVLFQPGQASALDTEVMSEGRDVGNITVTQDGELIVHDVTFAFVVHAFQPDLEIIQ
ncbi:MAG: DUF3179 domain-containing protein [Pseudomonadota bacterium]